MSRKRLTKEQKEEIFRRNKLNESPQKISKAIGCSDCTVRKILRRGTVENPKSKRKYDFKFTINECKEIRRKYEEEKLSTNQLAKKYSSSSSTIRKCVLRAGGKLRDFSEGLHVVRTPFSDDQIKEIVRLYENELKTCVDIAPLFNTGQSQIMGILKRYGNPDKYRTRKEVENLRLLISIEDTKKLYEKYKKDKNVTTKSLAEEAGIKRGTLEIAFKRIGAKLRDRHEAAAFKNRIFTDEEVNEICRMHIDENKNIRELTELFNSNHSTIRSAIDKYGTIKRRLEQTFWDPSKILDYGKKLLNGETSFPSYKFIEENHRGWNTAIGRHYPGGMHKLQLDLGIKPKQRPPTKLTKDELKDLCNLYEFGYTLRDLSIKFDTNPAFIVSILEDNNINRRETASGSGWDCVESALNNTGNFSIKRDTEFYIVGIKNFPEFVKAGISYDVKDRATKSYGYYGEEYLVKSYPSRQHAYFIEDIILNSTIRYFDCPEELFERDWGGLTELRRMRPDQLIEMFDFYDSELENLGLWQFAYSYVRMTDYQKEECDRRAKSENY